MNRLLIMLALLSALLVACSTYHGPITNAPEGMHDIGAPVGADGGRDRPGYRNETVLSASASIRGQPALQKADSQVMAQIPCGAIAC